MNMEKSPHARQNVPEEATDYQAQYISLDLALPIISNGWEETPKLRRGMQISLDSHEEFEFAMSNAGVNDDLYEPTMEVAPADELFFRGQLLPLQHDPRVHLVHTLSGIKNEHIEESVHFQSSFDEEMAMKLAYEEAFPFARTDDDGFFMDSSYQEGSTMKCGTEEGSDVQEGCNTFRSHGIDGGTDGLKNDSRSSSFRSQQSSYWGSGEKDSRDSSSSRCSNGSSQDGSCHGVERKAYHPSKGMESMYANLNANPCVKVTAAPNDKAQHGKPPQPASKLKKWSWKTILTGLRKASKIWVDDRVDGHNQSSISQRESKQKKAVFGFMATGQRSSRGLRMERDEHEGQFSSNNYMCSVEARKGRQQASSSRGKGWANEEYGGHISSKYYMGNGGWRGYNYYEGSNGGRPGKEKARMGIIAWNARESWQRWIKRPLHGKPSNTHKHTSIHEDMHGFHMKAKSLSSTPLTKSPVRRPDNVVNHDAEYGGACSSAKYMNVGFAASCPASMRSSPHHSGVLAVVSKGPPATSLHDLHTAIQGAIAHCKQSQSANPL